MALAQKTIVCACEDVTVHEIDAAIAQGYGDIESLKRYTGLGTGPCQGKSCAAAAMRICAERRVVPPEAQVPFRSRPPQAPTPLATYAGLPPEITSARVAQPGLRPTWGEGPHPLQPRAPLPERVDVVIIGGGIMGLALAWNLAASGGQKILVLERGYLCEGASGRNGGGVRATWGTPLLIELAKESIAFMGRFAQELGINVWLRKGGYLFLADDEETARKLEQGAELQKRHGLATRMIAPGEASEIVPQLDASKFIAASWNPDDGVVFPWPFVWGYADGARKRGAQVETFTRVTGLLGAAQAVPRPAGDHAPQRPLFLAVDARRDRRRHGRSIGTARPEPELVAAVPRPLFARADGADAASREREAPTPVGRLL